MGKQWISTSYSMKGKRISKNGFKDGFLYFFLSKASFERYKMETCKYVVYYIIKVDKIYYFQSLRWWEMLSSLLHLISRLLFNLFDVENFVQSSHCFLYSTLRRLYKSWIIVFAFFDKKIVCVFVFLFSVLCLLFPRVCWTHATSSLNV